MSIVPYLTMGLLAFVSLLLIFIVLLQRGRGGGLAGALGGAGGQSAFGTKAGDVFTRITIGLAVVWVLLGAMNVVLLRNLSTGRFEGGDEASTTPILEAPDKADESKTDGAADKASPTAGETSAKSAGAVDSEKKDETPAKPDETKPADDKARTPAAAESPKDEAKPDAAPEKPAAEEKKPE
jgi:preprotein translocase subunit SecG